MIDPAVAWFVFGLFTGFCIGVIFVAIFIDPGPDWFIRPRTDGEDHDR